jgi:hypothetical protein
MIRLIDIHVTLVSGQRIAIRISETTLFADAPFEEWDAYAQDRADRLIRKLLADRYGVDVPEAKQAELLYRLAGRSASLATG